jgi:hypothetical protein
MACTHNLVKGRCNAAHRHKGQALARVAASLLRAMRLAETVALILTAWVGMSMERKEELVARVCPHMAQEAVMVGHLRGDPTCERAGTYTGLRRVTAARKMALACCGS